MSCRCGSPLCCVPSCYEDRIIEVGIAGPTIRHILGTDPERWPLLRRALKTPIRKAFSTKVEWIVATLKRCDLGHMHAATKSEYNLTQIFRVQCRRTDSSPHRAVLEMLLDQIEYALRDGERHLDTNGYAPVATMGGVLRLLGRWPRKEDKIELFVLRDLIRRTSCDSVEWIVELTLQATKGSE